MTGHETPPPDEGHNGQPGQPGSIAPGDAAGDGSSSSSRRADRRRRSRGGGGVARAVWTTVSLLTGVAVIAAYVGYRALNDAFTAPGPLTEPATVVIPPGSTLDAIARLLAENGVIRDPMVFELGVRLAGRGRDLKAGEYRFDVAVTPRGALRTLTRGDVVARQVTVAEGLTTSRILALLRKNDGLDGSITLSPGEGALLPETYQFTRGADRDAILRRMMTAMDETVAALWETRAEDLPFSTPEEAVVLASIIEKETALASERPHVAGVFVNRLRKGMRLQSDPTVIYGLDKSGTLGRSLRRSDLEKATPYNTYVIDGLPPGPICNPGRDSIAAALNPMETKDLFFVADGTGGHAFAETLAEHNRNVAAWRRLLREQRTEND